MDVVDACRRWSVPPEAAAAAETVMSELVTNAVKHAGGELHVSLELAGDVLIVAVRDMSPLRPRRRRTVLGRESGRGLVIVSELSRSWGSLSTGDGGKVVWARVPVVARDRGSSHEPA